MMKCPECSYENSENSEFCRDCGGPLNDQPIITQDEESPDSPNPQPLDPLGDQNVDKVGESGEQSSGDQTFVDVFVPMDVKTACQHVRGPVKENDQDYCRTAEIEYPLHGFKIVVMVGADGIGGATGGERWANSTCDMFMGAIRTRIPSFDSQEKFLDRNHFRDSLTSQVNTWFFPTINWVTSCIYQFGSQEVGPKKLFGCTLVAAVVICDLETGTVSLWRYSVGDSSMFMLFDSCCEKLNEDHSRDGQLTKYVGQGMSANGTVEKQEFRIRPASLERVMLLLCSDGLTNMLSPEEILQHAFEVNTPSKAVRGLINAALKVKTPYGETINPNPDIPVTTGDDNIFVAITEFKTRL